MADQRPVLDFSRAFAIMEFHTCNLNMATAPIGAGDLTSRYAVPIQQSGLAIGKIERIGKSRYARKRVVSETTRRIGIRQRRSLIYQQPYVYDTVIN